MNTPITAAFLACASLLSFAPSAAPGDTMKAVRIHAYGKAEVLVYEDAPKPAPKAKQVLVEVRAAGVNPVDWKIRGGMMGMPITEPITLGFDIAGIVESVGEGVEEWKVGDEVFAYLPLARAGGYAEYAVSGVRELARKPAKLDFAHAGATPLASLTAWQALFDQGKLEAGQSVLIHGGSGGVGHFAVQLAHWKGAKVYATASEANLAFLKELGADVAIDYKAQKFEEIAKDVDVVLDSIGGETQQRSFGVLRKGGVLVSIVGNPDAKKAKELGVRATGMLVKPDGKQLAEIAQLLDTGKLKTVVSQVLPLAEARKAHELSESGHTKGKIVLDVPGAAPAERQEPGK